MMRADIFTLLSITQCTKVIKDINASEALQRECLDYLNKSRPNPEFEVALPAKTKGWNRILFDLCNYNYRTTALAVNQPADLAGVAAGRATPEIEPPCAEYVYAGFVPSGLHHFIIYSPRTQKAYFKELVIDLNHADLYPQETPQRKKRPQKTVADVWQTWVHDTEKSRQQAFAKDTEGKYFDLDVFMKDSKDVQVCRALTASNMEII